MSSTHSKCYVCGSYSTCRRFTSICDTCSTDGYATKDGGVCRNMSDNELLLPYMIITSQMKPVFIGHGADLAGRYVRTCGSV